MTQVTGRAGFAALVTAVCAGVSACGETTAETGGFTASLALQPVFPAAVTPGVFDLAVDRVRIVLIRPPAQALLDSTVFYPVDQNQLTVRVKVQLVARRERLAVLLELRSRETLLFVGTDTVEVGEASTLAPPVQLQYVGPGAEMTSLWIAPRDTALRPGDRFTFTVGAMAGATPLDRFYVAWSTSDPALAPVDAEGTISSPTTRGQVTLRVASPTGVQDSTTIAFSPPAQTVSLFAGNGQSWFAGAQLPEALVVRAVAADQQGVPGVRVRFRSLSGGRVRDTLVLTTATGHAATAGFLGPAAGLQAFEAQAPGFPPVAFTATALVGPAARIEILGGNAQTDTVGRTLLTPLIARVTDFVGNPVGGEVVNWSVVSGGGSLDRSSGTTNLSGIAFAEYTMGPFPGTHLIRATMARTLASVDFTATAVPGAPATITMNAGNAQADTAGATLAPFVVTVVDLYGNLLQGIAVRWSEVQGGGSLNPGSSTTGATGQATTTYRLPSVTGPVNVVAEVIGKPLSVVFGAVVLPATPIGLAVVGGDAQTGTVATALASFEVRVTDRFGNAVPGAEVLWEVAAGGGVLSAPSTNADAAGVARVTYTLGALPGANAVRARLATGAAVLFTATAIP